MKKLVYIFAALALFACEQADDFGQPNQGGTASGDLPEVIYATVADNDSDTTKTRTVVAEDGNSILWNTGDAITYIGPGTHTAKYVYEGDDRVASATFTYKEETGSYPHVALMPEIPYAVYPYSSDAHCRKVNDVAVLSVNFPAEQTYAENSFGRGASVMVGVGESADDTDFYFRNACGYLVIKLYDDYANGPCRVKTITLTALGGEKIAGTGLITASHGAAPVVAMTDKGSSTITLNCGDAGVVLGSSAESATEFWFAMPPVTFEKGFKIFVTPTQGLPFEMQTSKEVEITRRDIQPMAALKFTANGQAPNQLTYTTDKNEKFSFGYGDPFDAEIAAHYYDNRTQKFVIECGAPIKVINDYAFKRLAGDVSLTSVSLPSQLETIGDYAFHLNGLQELVIPGSVTMIKDHAFRDNRLKRLTFLCGNNDLEIRDSDNFGGAKGAFKEAFFDYIYIDRNIRFRDDLGGDYAYVDDMAMFEHSGEDTFVVEFGPNVTTITGSMFYGSKIQNLVIPGNITYIERNALTDIKSLE